MTSQVMLTNFCILGKKRSCIKIHYIFNHLDIFSESIDGLTEEQGERFQQDIRLIEKRFLGRWNAQMMSDIWWNNIRDCTQKIHKKSYKRSVLLDEVKYNDLESKILFWIVIITYFSTLILLWNLNVNHIFYFINL